MSSVTEPEQVPFEGKAREKAVLLLAAAEELDLDPSVVTTTEGAFLAPPEVVKKAFEARSTEQPEGKSPAKKRAAKKSTQSAQE